MEKASIFLSEIDGNVYGQVFSTSSFLNVSKARSDSTRLSRELDNLFHEEYTQAVENNTLNSLYPYVVFLRVAKGLNIKPFRSIVKEEILLPSSIITLADDEQLSPSEKWAIIGLLYLVAQDIERFDERFALECRIPASIHHALLDLVRSRNWKAEMNGNQVLIDEHFYSELENLIVEILKPEMSRIVTLSGLQPQSYQNSADRVLLKRISLIPGVGSLIGGIINTVKRSQELILMTNSQFVTPQSHPRLYKLFWMAVQILDIKDIPMLYIDSSLPGINAYTTGTDEKAYVAVSTEAAFLLDDRELLYIFGHELGHIQCDHVRYHALANVFMKSTAHIPVIGTLISAVSEPVIRPLLYAWLRCSELSADRAGLLCCQSREAVLRTIMKIGGQPWDQYGRIHTRALIDQTTAFLKTRNESDLDCVSDLYNRIYATHPYLIYRASELLLWIQNAEYEEHINTDERGRSALAKRVIKDANEQVLLKKVENFVVGWHMEHYSFHRKTIAKEVRKMLYEHTCPTCKPLKLVGKIDLRVEQLSASEFSYSCIFYTMNNKNEFIRVTRLLDYDSNRDEAPASLRAELLNNGGKSVSRVLYELNQEQ